MTLLTRTRALLGVGVILLVLTAGHRPSAALPATAAQPAEDSTGFVFLNGAYVLPPYTFGVVNGDVLLNGQVAAPSPIGDEPEYPSPPTDPQDAHELVQAAAARYRELGRQPTPEARAALIDLLRSFPATANVADEEDDLAVTDPNGEQDFVQLDFWPRGSADEIRQAQAELATEWQGLLAAGGGLFLTPGSTMTIPAGEAAAVVSSLFAIFDGLPADRPARLGDLLNDSSIEAAVLAAGPPPESLRVGRSRFAGETKLRAAMPQEALSVLADTASHKQSRTPKTRDAYLFVAEWKLGPTLDTNTVRWALESHGYKVHLEHKIPCKFEEDNSTLAGEKYLVDGGPGGATFENLLNTSGKAAVVYIQSHGGRVPKNEDQNEKVSTISLEEYCTKEQRQAAIKAYQDKRKNDPNSPVDPDALFSSQETFNMALYPDSFLKWKDANTIVHINACWAGGLDKYIKSREFIGPGGTIRAICGLLQNDSLWYRIAGLLDTGTKRNVGDAFAASDFPKVGFGILQSAAYVHVSNPPEVAGRTVLSPAVAKIEPAPETAQQVGATVTQIITFDAAMQATTASGSLVEVGGDCAPVLGDATWVDPYNYSFKWTPTMSGSAKFRLINKRALSGDNQAELDGNQRGRALVVLGSGPFTEDPAGTSHVQGNADDYLWEVTCKAPATGEQPRTPTQTPPPPPPTEEPTPKRVGLLLTPAQARPGQSVEAVATGFTPGEDGDLRLDEGIVAHGPVGGTGEARLSFTVPAVPPGRHTMRFGTVADRQSATAPFDVLPAVGGLTPVASSTPSGTSTAAPPGAGMAALILSQSQGRVGAALTVSGSGFTPNSTVRVCWVGAGGTCKVELFSGQVSAAGTFSFPSTVPSDTPGPHTIDATDGTGRRAAASFTITP